MLTYIAFLRYYFTKTLNMKHKGITLNIKLRFYQKHLLLFSVNYLAPCAGSSLLSALIGSDGSVSANQREAGSGSEHMGHFSGSGSKAAVAF